MRLTLAIPHLLTLDNATLNTAPALARLSRFAGNPTVHVAGLDAALLVATNAGADTPVAPLAALGAGFDPGNRYVMRADPVALIAGRDDVLLTGRVDDLTREEAAALVGTLNRHFGGDGLVFHAPRADAWFVTAPTAQRLATTPLPAVQGATYPHQPRGEDAGTWRQWLSEVQMLLHDHAVNAAREKAGQALVTGIWIWGGGNLAQTPTVLDAAPFAAAGPVGDVLRGLAQRSGAANSPPPSAYADLDPAKAAIVALPPLASSAQFAAVVQAWLDPAVAALERGELAALTLIADGANHALSWTATRPSLLARIRGRFDTRPFEPPPGNA